jgi:ABC-type lipoprotein release transport system permease subunit
VKARWGHGYEALVAQNTAVRRMIMSLLPAFAGVAMALAMFGVYSVTAYAVGQSTGEIGVHMAMGALPEQVQRMVIAQGLHLTAVGVAIRRGRDERAGQLPPVENRRPRLRRRGISVRFRRR